MIQRLKSWIQSKLFIGDLIVPLIKVKTEQENPRDAATRKRVREAFKAQEQQMQSRAMKAHSADCEDPLTCKKRICFVWKPDQIVNKEQS